MIRREGELWVGSFRAMAGPCEVLIQGGERTHAERSLAIAAHEARRVERKFSRYRRGSVVDRINRAGGKAVEVDEECARLLDFATVLYEMSEGRFDISSGVLRAAWRFDGSDRLPDPADVKRLRRRIGWDRARWDGRRLRLDPGMEIDLGGIGKEYAVDRCAHLLATQVEAACLVNFGGDLATSRSRDEDGGWRVGIENPEGGNSRAKMMIALSSGGLATSGDARRFLLKDGVRYSHILDPRSGWPVRGAPRSVSVVAESCVQAGMLATLAMLEGESAESFLGEQQVQHWILR